jgi:hypothetical protein
MLMEFFSIQLVNHYIGEYGTILPVGEFEV